MIYNKPPIDKKSIGSYMTESIKNKILYIIQPHDNEIDNFEPILYSKVIYESRKNNIIKQINEHFDILLKTNYDRTTKLINYWDNYLSGLSIKVFYLNNKYTTFFIQTRGFDDELVEVIMSLCSLSEMLIQTDNALLNFVEYE